MLTKKFNEVIFPSLYEGFGLPPLEALMAGIPVIVSNISVMHEVFKDNVLYFNPIDISDLKNTIKCFSNYTIHKSISILDRYSWNVVCDKYIEIFFHMYVK